MPITPTRRAAVLGHPVAHSLSPLLHGAAYAALGLDDWSYTAIDVTEDELPAFVAAMDDSWAGLSLTMPLKQAVIPLLDAVDPLAQVVGAVNTLVPSARTKVGTNTDVHGLVAALREGLVHRGADARPGRSGAGAERPEVGSAVVLGAGATAASTLAALGELGCTAPHVLVRSLARTGELRAAAHRMGTAPQVERLDHALERMLAADVVVSTMPKHAADPLADDLLAARAAGRELALGVLLDVVYDPRPTALSRAWQECGGTVVGGERMLLHQAAEQVRLMTGRAAPLAAMDTALETALAAR
ncbi:shikimate dehydrogenase [Sediminihabitans luteus]|uniref:Shikimate dehydrogenase n=1 Tax=Sediminihabitans luteus TaxID=1138585 RepID=A0A2M9CQK4_9CELL|nr:shikimate dehydrogenase [Sediminihabitans luteus]PJJ74184.1 shikimate dehydrogenase [Sediminihabitans luteus]GII99037.1 shikimate 5-dehydrogenase [Sediminihabitans luteus]